MSMPEVMEKENTFPDIVKFPAIVFFGGIHAN
jgi:hypothetical protein